MRIVLLAVMATTIILSGSAPAGAAAAPALDAASVGRAAPAHATREAAIVCGNTGCYTPQVHDMRRRKLHTLGRG